MAIFGKADADLPILTQIMQVDLSKPEEFEAIWKRVSIRFITSNEPSIGIWAESKAADLFVEAKQLTDELRQADPESENESGPFMRFRFACGDVRMLTRDLAEKGKLNVGCCLECGKCSVMVVYFCRDSASTKSHLISILRNLAKLSNSHTKFQYPFCGL